MDSRRDYEDDEEDEEKGESREFVRFFCYEFCYWFSSSNSFLLIFYYAFSDEFKSEGCEEDG